MQLIDHRWFKECGVSNFHTHKKQTSVINAHGDDLNSPSYYDPIISFYTEEHSNPFDSSYVVNHSILVSPGYIHVYFPYCRKFFTRIPCPFLSWRTVYFLHPSIMHDIIIPFAFLIFHLKSVISSLKAQILDFCGDHEQKG